MEKCCWFVGATCGVRGRSEVYYSSLCCVAGVGAVLDPDFIVVGCPTDRSCEPVGAKERAAETVSSAYISGYSATPLSDVEQRTQFSVWCLWGAPLIIGSDVRNLSSFALATLSNQDAIAINQDPLMDQPRLILKTATVC